MRGLDWDRLWKKSCDFKDSLYWRQSLPKDKKKKNNNDENEGHDLETVWMSPALKPSSFIQFQSYKESNLKT